MCRLVQNKSLIQNNMKKQIPIFTILSFLLFSCKNDLDRTIFIPDEDDYRLPAYTEWGYNSFGAEYERDYFLASQHIVPCKIMCDNEQLRFSLNGTIRNSTEMTLEFIFPVAQMLDYTGLAQLNDMIIDLSADNCTVKIWQGENETVLEILNGKLHFKRTQLLYVDDTINRVILSGIFELRFLQKGYPTTISNGRFDLGITDKVFYSQ
jgi:hypothetical protein